MRTLVGQTSHVRALCLVFAAAMLALAPKASTTAPEDAQADARFIANQLEHCPLWKDIAPQDATRRQQITNVYLKLARYPTEVIRAGVYLYVNPLDRFSGLYTDAGYKVFAFERVVFRVPVRFRNGERFAYALLGNPLIPEGTTTYVDSLWPYSIGDAGQLVLTGSGFGQLTGPPYDPIADFDNMATRLPRRFPAAWPSR